MFTKAQDWFEERRRKLDLPHFVDNRRPFKVGEIIEIEGTRGIIIRSVSREDFIIWAKTICQEKWRDNFRVSDYTAEVRFD